MPDEGSVRCAKGICLRRMKVMRDDRPYCVQHDPEKLAARRAARFAKRQTEKEVQEQVRASASALATRLGAGHPEYSLIVLGKGRYTGGIVLTAEEVQRLIERLCQIYGAQKVEVGRR